VAALIVAALPSVLVVAGAAQQGWRDDTHGRNATPDYVRVFPENTVKRLDIQIASADWERLRADMAEMAGAPGVEGGGRQEVCHRTLCEARHAPVWSKGGDEN